VNNAMRLTAVALLAGCTSVPAPPPRTTEVEVRVPPPSRRAAAPEPPPAAPPPAEMAPIAQPPPPPPPPPPAEPPAQNLRKPEQTADGPRRRVAVARAGLVVLSAGCARG
jgi:hypothetical protein